MDEEPAQLFLQVREGREVVDRIVRSQKVTYGINTGFGNFANTVIPSDKLGQLQLNLIRSHAVGVGLPIALNLSRMLCVLRINALAKGHSGISSETLKALIRLLNMNLIPLIPSQGTVGASGDLCPLAHLALGLLGEGQMWNPATEKYEDAAAVLKQHGVKTVALQPKEGLALINGTQFISAIGCEAIVRAKGAARVADLVAAFSVEVLQGTWKAYVPQIHAARPHKGQGSTAERVLRFLRGWKSEVSEAHAECGKVQDAYTLRCVPQIHGICRETLTFVYNILKVEINSATDNPMVFAQDDSIISGGNFHGEYPAKACDFLAIAVHELASVSERRIERMCNPSLNGHLPAFLVRAGGLNSGFMMAHVTAASLVSENKGLCHPVSFFVGCFSSFFLIFSLGFG
jgi:histidine ammonia-lyase